MKDTPEDFETMAYERIMNRSPEERLRLGCGMFDLAKAIVVASLPNLEGGELRVAVFERLYGDDFDDTEKSKIHIHIKAFDNVADR